MTVTRGKIPPEKSRVERYSAIFFRTRFAVFLAAERATPTGPIFLNDSAASADAAAASMPSRAASAASAPYLQGLHK